MSAKARLTAINALRAGVTPTAPRASQRLRLVVSGYVCDGDEEDILELCETARAAGITGVDVLISSAGGSVYAGVAIAQAVSLFEDSVAYTGATCMSIATVIAAACKRVVSSDNSMWMAHGPMVFALVSSVEEAEACGKQWAMCRDSIKAVYRQRMTLTDAALDDLLSGADKFMTPGEAQALGLVDEVVAGFAHPDLVAVNMAAKKEEESDLLEQLMPAVAQALRPKQKENGTGPVAKPPGAATPHMPANGGAKALLTGENTPTDGGQTVNKWGGNNSNSANPTNTMTEQEKAHLEALTAANKQAMKALAAAKGVDETTWTEMLEASKEPAKVFAALQALPNPQPQAAPAPAPTATAAPAGTSSATAAAAAPNAADQERLSDLLKPLTDAVAKAATPSPTDQVRFSELAKEPGKLHALAQTNLDAVQAAWKAEWPDAPELTKDEVAKYTGRPL